MNLKAKPLALAATLALASSLAFADDLVQTLTLTPNSGSLTASFTATHLQSSFFVDNFDFTLPATPGGTAMATLFSNSPDLNLFGGFFAGESFLFMSAPGGGQSASVTAANVSGPQGLSVFGTAGDAFAQPPVQLSATYTGTITYTPAVIAIPEPATFALMFAGLFAVGTVARRRLESSRA